MLRRASSLAAQVPITSGTIQPAIRTWPMQSIRRSPVVGVSVPRRHLVDTPAPAQKGTLAEQIEYHGGCHCGSIKVHFRTRKTPSELGSRACQCSFCRLHGASFTSDPAGTLSVEASGPVNRYRMGTGTAEFLTCSQCGVVPAATWRRDDGDLLSVVRVQCLDTRIREELLAHETKWSVEHELDNPQERLSRRSRNWTPTSVETSS